MAPNSCTVAVDIEDHHITIHFKADEQVRNIYVHPDNVVLTSNTRSWSKRRGDQCTFHQNKYEARQSIELLCRTLKEDRAGWRNLSVDQVMASICDKIGMSTTLWMKIKKWSTSQDERALFRNGFLTAYVPLLLPVDAMSIFAHTYTYREYDGPTALPTPYESDRSEITRSSR
ncbi:hypothetical protein K443DRAFT_656378 [Laccaria amethystina LaAM-08-1]|uniref:Uncharacterized protein n=1 Tax=Laccaria amethystina LaAM-08-1 TaxID=1095629 RepID=A0A0C9X3L8_9AGAR|nr:hypothetical protein K443DRAFT_656378 [Laccaria amethystina LaAM-08-1]